MPTTILSLIPAATEKDASDEELRGVIDHKVELEMALDESLATERSAIYHELERIGTRPVLGNSWVGFPGADIIVELAKTHLPEVAAIVAAWIHGRFGRKIRIKVGEIEVEATSPAEVESLLRTATELAAGRLGEPAPD